MAETDVGSGIFIERGRESGAGLFRAGTGIGSGIRERESGTGLFRAGAGFGDGIV